MHRVGRWWAVVIVLVVFATVNVGQVPSSSAQDASDEYTLENFWWPAPAVEYRVNLNGAPPGALEAILNAAATWNAVPGAQVQLNYAGVTTVAQGANDGVNTVYWAPLAGGLGLTDQFLECIPACTKFIGFDIALSSTEPIRVGSVGTDNFDLESIMLHEFGHALGLDHAAQGQVMFALLLAGGEVRSLAAGDRQGLLVRYPDSNGDVNCDGRVNIVDAFAVAQYSVDLRADAGRCPATGPLSGRLGFALMGDANRDNRVNIADAYLVARCAVGLSTPICEG